MRRRGKTAREQSYKRQKEATVDYFLQIGRGEGDPFAVPYNKRGNKKDEC